MSYQGTPYHDAKHPGGPQRIPGRVMCACYDLGGENVAYHTNGGVNHGSGELNPVDGSYLHSFRLHEGVSTSYVKFFNEIDNSIYNKVQPEEHMLYVGWTEPGEWIKLTVDVAETAAYAVSLLYTSQQGGQISLSVDGRDVTGPLNIPTTYRADDPLDWRQWHHWNKLEIARADLTEGVQVLTLRTVENGNMNYGYLEFTTVSL